MELFKQPADFGDVVLLFVLIGVVVFAAIEADFTTERRLERIEQHLGLKVVR